MERFDLSFNRLQGQISQQLTYMSSLIASDVSYTNLSRLIPVGKQFNTFDTRNYYLCSHLICEQPINRSYNNNNIQEHDNEVELMNPQSTLFLSIGVLLRDSTSWNTKPHDAILIVTKIYVYMCVMYILSLLLKLDCIFFHRCPVHLHSQAYIPNT